MQDARGGLRSEVWGIGFRVYGSGFRVQGSGFRAQDSGFRVQGSGLGSRVRVQCQKHKARTHTSESVHPAAFGVLVVGCTDLPNFSFFFFIALEPRVE